MRSIDPMPNPPAICSTIGRSVARSMRRMASERSSRMRKHRINRDARHLDFPFAHVQRGKIRPRFLRRDEESLARPAYPHAVDVEIRHNHRLGKPDQFPATHPGDQCRRQKMRAYCQVPLLIGQQF